MEKLYRITFIRQDSGEEQTQYILANDMSEIEEAYSDILKVEPVMFERL